MISNLTLVVCALLVSVEGEASTQIDSLLEKRYVAESIQTSPKCSDLQFLRRVSLDLIGRVPTPEECHQFERNPDRNALVERLLSTPEFSRFLSEVWTSWWIGYTPAFQSDRETFRIWLQSEIELGASFKSIAHQIILAEGSVAKDGPVNFIARHIDQPSVNLCRAFLGVRIECAQCHDHPFDRWTQEDYEKLSRFFSGVRRTERNGTVIIRDEVRQEPEELRPRFLTGSTPRTGSYRKELALYVTRCKPFARNFANRVWYQLMGQGIIDPPDDHNLENPPVDRELLELLTSFAVSSEFDIRAMFRVICGTEAYQRETATAAFDARAIELFAARKLKPLLAEQYIDSLETVLQTRFDRQRRREMIRQYIDGQELSEDFHETWKYRETVQQLMRKITYRLPTNNRSSLDDLFLRVLSRRPTQDERDMCDQRSQSDVMFALVFGNEFYFNH